MRLPLKGAVTVLLELAAWQHGGRLIDYVSGLIHMSTFAVQEHRCDAVGESLLPSQIEV